MVKEMIENDEIQERILMKLRDLHGFRRAVIISAPTAAGPAHLPAISISPATKEDVSGTVNIRIKARHSMRACIPGGGQRESGLKDGGFTTIYTYETVTVIVGPGCGIHNCGDQTREEHDGISTASTWGKTPR